MVSKAREDLPDPLRPVTTVRVLRGISTSMFLRLCWRAPRTEILVMAIWYCLKIRAGWHLRNVDRSAYLFEIRSAQLYSVFYYGAPVYDASGWSLAAGGNTGRLKMPHRRKLSWRHLNTGTSYREFF